jgi:hypothetical protein
MVPVSSAADAVVTAKHIPGRVLSGRNEVEPGTNALGSIRCARVACAGQSIRTSLRVTVEPEALARRK